VEAFCEMLQSIPARAAVRAVEAQRRMLVNDIALQRIALDQDATSMLSFCNFVLDAARGLPTSPQSWPADDRDGYRKIVQRLIDAGELPYRAGEQMDVASAGPATPA